MFNRRSFCSTFTLHLRMAAYTCSSTHAHGTGGTCVRSTRRGALLIRQSHSPYRALVLSHVPVRASLPFVNLKHSGGISDLNDPPHLGRCVHSASSRPCHRLRRPQQKKTRRRSRSAVRLPSVLTSLPSILLSSEDPHLFAPVRQRKAQPCQIWMAAADCSLDSRDLPAAPLDSRGRQSFQADLGE